MRASRSILEEERKKRGKKKFVLGTMCCFSPLCNPVTGPGLGMEWVPWA